MSWPQTASSTPRGGVAVFAIGALLLAACSKQAPPRTYTEFMEDSIARDGVIARCNQNPEESAGDIECANARRAAASIALNEERARYDRYERESEQKLAELRAAIDRRDRAKQAALAAAIAAAEAAYEAQWVESDELPGELDEPGEPVWPLDGVPAEPQPEATVDAPEPAADVPAAAPPPGDLPVN